MVVSGSAARALILAVAADTHVQPLIFKARIGVTHTLAQVLLFAARMLYQDQEYEAYRRKFKQFRGNT